MADKMLIDAAHPEETRVVVLRGNRVEEFDFESANRKQLRGNIYLAKVTRVEPSLQAAFVDYGGNRHGFLAFSEIHPDYYQIPVADRQALIAEEARAQLPRAQEIAGIENIARDATQTIRDNDYRYGPELEPLAEKHRRGLTLSMADLGVHLTDFMAALAADDTLRDTVVIVTADHGSMYAKGRFWYGFHPNEEVTRVPLLIFNAGRTGRDDRLVGTLDIGASVLGFFGLARESESGHSVLAPGPGRARTHTLTLRSDRNKEWFLVLSEAARKYRVNLHPGGRGETATLRLDGYDETPVAETIGPPEGLAGEIAAAVRGYGIDPAEIHPALRP